MSLSARLARERLKSVQKRYKRRARRVLFMLDNAAFSVGVLNAHLGYWRQHQLSSKVAHAPDTRAAFSVVGDYTDFVIRWCQRVKDVLASKSKNGKKTRKRRVKQRVSNGDDTPRL